jgi:hypothetical protein
LAGGTAVPKFRRTFADVAWLVVLAGLLAGSAYLTGKICRMQSSTARLPVLFYK